jgi:hypothetical protein
MTTQNAQLSLIQTPRSWRIDERTREVGRAGIAQARAALRNGRQTRTQDPPSSEAQTPERSDTEPPAAAATERHRRDAA